MTVRVSRKRARRRRVRRSDRDSGAAAVEFALVVPILVLLLFGIIDYGLWFSDTLSVRSGVHDAARQAAVANFDAPTCALDDSDHTVVGSPSGDVKSAMCAVRDQIGGVTGDIYVGIKLPRDPAGTGPDGWYVGQPLTVCAVVVEKGITGYVPLPDDHKIKAKSVLTIEQPTATAEVSGFQQTTSGDLIDWSWCTG